MGKQTSKNGKSEEDADILQALDETNQHWVGAWKKAVKKEAKCKTEL